jgi:D-alanyl-D-alanine carboxypeptidase
VTKTFTAAVILQLAGEGRLGLDDPVERWLPGVVPAGAAITVRQLLNHTSGLYNYTRDLTADGILRDRSRQWTPYEIVEQAVRREPDFPPGTSRAYNNTAYVLLGMVIQQVTGSSYAEQIRRRILHPLDLRRTRVDDHDESLPEPHARGYLTVAGKPVDLTVCSPSHAGAAGGMISTAADLNRFFAELMTGNLIGASERQEMLATVATGTPGVDSGLGIARYTLPNGTVVWGKDGGFHGYRTWVFQTADTAHQLTVSMTAALINSPATHEFIARAATAFGLPGTYSS